MPREREPYDYHAAAISMLTLRINSAHGEWLSDADLEIFGRYLHEASAREEWGLEYTLLAMLNAAWLAIQYLTRVTGEGEATWLQRIAADLRRLGVAQCEDE